MNMTRDMKTLLLIPALLSLNAFVTVPAAQAADNQGHSVLHSVNNFMDDSAVTAKVKTALIDDKEINSTNLSLSTTRGVVTVDGFVSSAGQVAHVERLIRKTQGVKGLVNHLHIKSDQQTNLKSYASDTATTSEIMARLMASKQVEARHISVTTTHGNVVLSGQVDDRRQKQAAAEIVKKVSGVSAVKNELSVSH